MEQSKDSYLDGYWDGSQLDWRSLPQNIRDQFVQITDPSQKSFLTDYPWYFGCQSYQPDCTFDPSYQFSNPYNKVKADPSEFYNSLNDSAWRISATYLLNEDTNINLQYEQYNDEGKGWTNIISCELRKTVTGKFVGDPAIYPANTCTDIMLSLIHI